LPRAGSLEKDGLRLARAPTIFTPTSAAINPIVRPKTLLVGREALLVDLSHAPRSERVGMIYLLDLQGGLVLVQVLALKPAPIVIGPDEGLLGVLSSVDGPCAARGRLS
jgi:hypothetical protein